jgi:hypothetical protein
MEWGIFSKLTVNDKDSGKQSGHRVFQEEDESPSLYGRGVPLSFEFTL